MTGSLSPKSLFIALRGPAEAIVRSEFWDFNDETKVRGVPVEADDNPWASFSDLLINPDSREFVGISVAAGQSIASDPQGLDPSLNSEVIRYYSLESDEAKERYPGQDVPRCEIIWSTSPRVEFQWAQLMFAQCAWLYTTAVGPCGPSLLAFVVTDVDEILDQHALKLPRLGLPPLTVAIQRDRTRGP